MLIMPYCAVCIIAKMVVAAYQSKSLRPYDIGIVLWHGDLYNYNRKLLR
jgi:hypothetical protein